MSETISIMFDENGRAIVYDDTFDITIHCESEEEQNRVLEILNREEKTAAWVSTDEEPHEVYECNACEWLLYDVDRTDFKYCPNCGARMVSE